MAGIVVLGDCQAAEFGRGGGSGWGEVVSADCSELLSRLCSVGDSIFAMKRKALIWHAPLHLVGQGSHRVSRSHGAS